MTGATVALLIVGLVAAGVGTAVSLRYILTANVDSQIDALARTDAAAPFLEMTVEDGQLQVEEDDEAPPADYFVAVYGPVDGKLLGTAGGRGGPEPVFPETFPLDKAQSQELQTFTLTSEDQDAEFRGTATVQELAPAGVLYTQVVAIPLAGVNRTIGTYLAVYSILVVVIIVGGAFLTRLLVTLTFRSLGQVESTAQAIAAGDFSQRMTDIEPETTEVGRLKTALNTMLGRVDAAISERDATVSQMRRFIGDASHELRTPLVTVRGYAELYRMGAIAGDDDVAQAMDRIESEAKRMGVLVEDLLALARLDERRDVVATAVDLRPIARDAALDVRATSPLREVTVIDTTAGEEPLVDAAPRVSGDEPITTTTRRQTAGRTPLSLLRRRSRPVPASSATGIGEQAIVPLHFDPVEVGSIAGVAPIVLGDENRIRQVVTNLLGNARRFTADDSPIELRVGVDPGAGMGWIEVADHGEGVPDQIKDKIFQRFWRADNSRTRETGGSGLGLSIVASIIDSLGGSVSVFDTPGGGATFRVAVPLAPTRDSVEALQLETQPIEPLDRL